MQLVVLTGLEKVLAEEQVFQVEDLVLLRDEGMLETVFTKYVARRKVELALDRHKLQVSGQGAGEQWASSGWAAGEQARSPAASGDEAEAAPPRVAPQLPAVAVKVALLAERHARGPDGQRMHSPQLARCSRDQIRQRMAALARG